MRSLCSTLGLLLVLSPATRAATINVPGNFPTIQAALNVAVAGDTIVVAAGTYGERIQFPRSGSAGAGFISLEAAAGSRPVLDGTGVGGCDMVRLDTRSYVRIRGFEIRNALAVSDCSGVRIVGSGSHIEVSDNVIHDIRGTDAMAITVYGTDPQPISDLVIDGNVIYDCEPAQSEALTLNGNVTAFAVTRNVVRDVNNIGIDFIGGEPSIQPDPALVARNGVCSDNTVLRAKSNYGGGYAAGIYVDGGKDIIIERNIVSGSDLGIEVAAENAGIITSGIIVRDNFIHANDKVGLVFGGYDVSAGRANGNSFLNNTLFGNDTTGQGLGELWIQYAESNTLRNNLFYCTAQNVLLYSEAGNVNNVLDDNLWFAAAGATAAEFTWQSTTYTGFAAYQAGTGQDGSSIFADPMLAAPASGDLHIQSGSPAVDRGDPAFTAGPGETDIDGQARVANGRVDIGADEIVAGSGDIVVGEGLGVPNPNRVRVYTGGGSATSVDFLAYAAGGWGVNVGAGEIDADGYDELLTGPGPGAVFGPQVRAFQRTGSALGKVNFYAYGTLRFGANVAGGAIDGDPYSEILTGAGPGAVFGPHVRAFDYDASTLTAIAKVSYFAYSTLKFGVNVAAGAIDGDVYEEIVTGPGPGVIFGPQVRAFDVDGGSVTSIAKVNFNAFPTPNYGARVTSAEFDGDTFDELAVSPGPGPGGSFPGRFVGFGYDGSAIAPLAGFDVTPFGSLYGGRLGGGEITGSGASELLTGAGPDPAAPSTVISFIYTGSLLSQLPNQFTPYASDTYGVNMQGASMGY